MALFYYNNWMENMGKITGCIESKRCSNYEPHSECDDFSPTECDAFDLLPSLQEVKQGQKFDLDPYEKPDLSLVPWEILSKYYHPHGSFVVDSAREIHHILNNDIDDISINDLLTQGIREIGVAPLAVALGYGCVKYGRDNWRKGFGGDWKRFLRASLRHCHSCMMGSEYDGCAIEGYPKGNLHSGAILFSLMVADKEFNAGGDRVAK